MHRSKPEATETRSFWSRRWPTMLALVAGITVSLLALFVAYHFGGIADGPHGDWLGLAFYLCGAAVAVTQVLYLLATRRRHGRRGEAR